MADDKICPCQPLPAQLTVQNGPGRDSIAYRIGDFNSIRRALLLSLPDEKELTAWRPDAKSDLALQMIEWWAYLGDILTFYNERIANQGYLRTADLPESVRRLVGLLGYRPRPGIAATGMLAALVSGPSTFTIPRGFSIDSKPGPRQEPQTFELDQDTVVGPNDNVPARPLEYLLSPVTNQFLVGGSAPQIQTGSILLLISRNPAAQPITPGLVSVTGVQTEITPAKTKQTRVTITPDKPLSKAFPAEVLRVQRSTQSIGLWTVNGTPVSGSTVHLAGVARDIHPGSLVVFAAPNAQPLLATVSAVQEVLWYLNGKSGDPNTPPDNPPTVPAGVLHTVLTVSQAPSADKMTVTVLFSWQDVNPLLNQPLPNFNGATPLQAIAPAVFQEGNSAPVLIDGADGSGLAATGTVSNNDTVLSLSDLPSQPPIVSTPLQVFYNLLQVSRGKTVANEILGSGDATAPGQEFVLKKSPVTYLAKGAGYASTVAVRVDGRLWKEVASFYGQQPDAEIFVTSEDDQQKTHVKFGDGVHGARLPTGLNNVTATYRYGSGAQSPPAGKLTVISKPFPNVTAVRNPVPVGGGADPDPADQIRKYAPKSVLTFGRAVSADDYEIIAAQSPGVNRARSYWTWSGEEQRAVVTVYVGDDDAALASAKSALASSGDPNRKVAVVAATPVFVIIHIRLLVDPRYVPDDVAQKVRPQFLDATLGLFGSNRLRIGEAVFNSQIDQACLSVEGAVSVAEMYFVKSNQNEFQERHDPGEGAFFLLQPKSLIVVPEVSGHAG